MTTNVLRLSEKHYKVKTDSDEEYCDVECANYAWTCSCHDHTTKAAKCAHISIAQLSADMRRLAQPKNEIVSVTKTTKDAIVKDTIAKEGMAESEECIYCHSKNVRKHSIRHNKSGDVQRYFCRECQRKYSATRTSEDVTKTPASDQDIVAEAVALYFDGKKSAEISDMLHEKYESINVIPEIVSDWIYRYKGILQGYINTIDRTQTSKWNYKSMSWESDYVYKRAKKDLAYLYSVLDNKTKVWIAYEMWTAKDDYTKTLSPYKVKQIRAFYNNECSILHI
jgi:putative transposase